MEKEYVVKLSKTVNGFYDPDCMANLSAVRSIYAFTHKPTKAIINAVKSGRLIDCNGNIEEHIHGKVEASAEALKEFDIKGMIKDNIDDIVAIIMSELDSKYIHTLALKVSEEIEKNNAAKTVEKPVASETEKPVAEKASRKTKTE